MFSSSRATAFTVGGGLRSQPPSGLLTLILAFGIFAEAQDSPPSAGTNAGNYNLRQTLEVGYRHTDFTGSQAVYDTLVNLNSVSAYWNTSWECGLLITKEYCLTTSS